MHFRRGAVTMIWKDSDQVQGQSGLHAAGDPLRLGIENIRRESRNIAVAREEVRAEQQPEPFAIKSGVPGGVAGEVHRAQAVPHIDKIAVVQPAVRNEWPKG